MPVATDAAAVATGIAQLTQDIAAVNAAMAALLGQLRNLL
jgi:hypothetical protein